MTTSWLQQHGMKVIQIQHLLMSAHVLQADIPLAADAGLIVFRESAKVGIAYLWHQNADWMP
jgi:hypothetical protein